jgi:tetratricopeptide (TPR) repeat protein/transcriptional regulator with XRE-family HTH domain
MTDDAGSFGTRLRSFRLLAELSQEELAERSGVSVRTIGTMEGGRARKPYQSTCEGLADALGLRGTARAEFVAAGRRLGKTVPAAGVEQPGGAWHAADRPWMAPRHLPAPVPCFVGRCDELAELSQILSRPGRTASIAVISGSPGIGKTALALRWAHDAAAQFPDGQLYVDLRGYGPDQPVSPADALASLLRALGVAGLTIPEGTAERAAAYRSLLAGKQVLVVLDNAGGSAQVRPLLPGGGECAVLMTSRNPLAGVVAREGASRLELDVLSPAQAADLLRGLIGARVTDDPPTAAALASYCSRLPLALRVAAELAVAQPLLPLATLASQLADLRYRVGLLDAGGDEQTSVQSVLSWSYRQLDAAAARAFRLLGQHPGPDFDGYAAAALTGTTVDDAGRLLEKLARAYLIQPSGPGRYGMHDLLRAYAREHAAGDRQDGGTEPADEEPRAALTRLFDYYLQTTAAARATLFAARRYQRPHGHWAGVSAAVGTKAAACAWLEAELGNLVAAAAQMAEDGWPGQASRLASAIFPYLEQASRVAEAITIESHALRASRRTADKVAEARALGNLGHVFLMQGRYQQAAGHLGQAVAIFRQAGDQRGEACALGSLAVVNRRLGHYQRAGNQQSRALALVRGIGDQWAEALALMRLGTVDWNRGRYQQALERIQEAVCVSRQIGDPLSEAEALTRLAVVERHLGRYQDAKGHHELAIALFRHGRDQAGEAEALDGLGEVSLAMGQPVHAVAHHTAALHLAEETGDLNEQARAHHGLACAHQAVGEHALAQPRFEEAIRLFSVLGAPEARQIRARPSAANDNDTRNPRGASSAPTA